MMAGVSMMLEIMELLSQQIRKLVEKSSTSSYAIAQQAGIDKSAMSRFMNGGRLTMDKLDQLAKVLGVSVIQEVTQVKRPPVKGRPRKGKADKMQASVSFTKRDYEGLAHRAARDAFENELSTRRGVWFYEDWGLLVVFNNNPFNDTSVRRKEIAALVRDLKRAGIKSIARGQYGDTLDDGKEKYTQTLVLECGNDRLQEVVDLVDEIGSVASWNAYHPTEKPK
jgi:transcriptional regulator with XRE-family HTH domain